MFGIGNFEEVSAENSAKQQASAKSAKAEAAAKAKAQAEAKATQANANIFGFLGIDAAKLLQKQCPIGVYVRKTDAGVY